MLHTQPIPVSKPYDPMNPGIINPSEPPFLRENWKKLLATAPEGRRRIKVTNEVANLCSDAVLIRSRMPGYADGFYLFAQSGTLVSTDPSQSLDFPDVDAARPKESALGSSQAFANEYIQRLLMFVEEVRVAEKFQRYEAAEIVLDGEGLYSRHNSKLFIKMNFPLPFSGDGVAVKADHLKIALTECLRYDHMYIAHENNPDRKTPILFGLNWNSCALVWPTFWSRKL